jgi:hypothetical protein
MSADLMTPSVHLNGTSGEQLFEQVCGVLDVLRALRKAMDDASPNARDYYIQGDDAFKIAVLQHDARGFKVTVLIEEYQALAEGIADQRGV